MRSDSHCSLNINWNLSFSASYIIAGARKVQCREGYRGIHQEGVRQEVQPNLALYRGTELRYVLNADNIGFVFSECPSAFPHNEHADGFAIAGSYVTHETKHFIYFYLGTHHFHLDLCFSLLYVWRLLMDSVWWHSLIIREFDWRSRLSELVAVFEKGRPTATKKKIIVFCRANCGSFIQVRIVSGSDGYSCNPHLAGFPKYIICGCSRTSSFAVMQNFSWMWKMDATRSQWLSLVEPTAPQHLETWETASLQASTSVRWHAFVFFHLIGFLWTLTYPPKFGGCFVSFSVNECMLCDERSSGIAWSTVLSGEQGTPCEDTVYRLCIIYLAPFRCKVNAVLTRSRSLIRAWVHLFYVNSWNSWLCTNTRMLDVSRQRWPWILHIWFYKSAVTAIACIDPAATSKTGGWLSCSIGTLMMLHRSSPVNPRELLELLPHA